MIPTSLQLIADQLNADYAFFAGLTRHTDPDVVGVADFLKRVENLLNLLEASIPLLRTWLEEYLAEHRGELWLLAGLAEGNKVLKDPAMFASLVRMRTVWPVLFDRLDARLGPYEVDLEGAIKEVRRQKAREHTRNPNYESMHPDGCPRRGCCCWMLADMEQWDVENAKEKEESRNIFFNPTLQTEFCAFLKADLPRWSRFWTDWSPARPALPKMNLNVPGDLTPIQILREWSTADFLLCPLLSLFCGKEHDVFQNIWNHIEYVEYFVAVQRIKLRRIPAQLC